MNKVVGAHRDDFAATIIPTQVKLCCSQVLREFDDVFILSASKAIDRLIVVGEYADCGGSGGQGLNDGELCRVGVLELVYKKMRIPIRIDSRQFALILK